MMCGLIDLGMLNCDFEINYFKSSFIADAIDLLKPNTIYLFYDIHTSIIDTFRMGAN